MTHVLSSPNSRHQVEMWAASYLATSCGKSGAALEDWLRVVRRLGRTMDVVQRATGVWPRTVILQPAGGVTAEWRAGPTGIVAWHQQIGEQYPLVLVRSWSTPHDSTGDRPSGDWHILSYEFHRPVRAQQTVLWYTRLFCRRAWLAGSGRPPHAAAHSPQIPKGPPLDAR